MAVGEVGEVLDRKRKREAKKQRKKDEKRMKKDSVECAYDETLLAVIGILDTIKTQGNIAGWIRAEGLWAESRVVEAATESAGAVEEVNRVESTSKEGAEEEEGSGCESDMSISSKSTSGTPSKTRSVSDLSPRPSSSASERALYAPSPKESPKASRDVKTFGSEPIVDVQVPPSSPRPYTLPTRKVDAVGPAQKSLDILKGDEEEQKWYESEAAMAIWVSRGRSALAALDIPAVSGVLT